MFECHYSVYQDEAADKPLSDKFVQILNYRIKHEKYIFENKPRVMCHYLTCLLYNQR